VQLARRGFHRVNIDRQSQLGHARDAALRRDPRTKKVNNTVEKGAEVDNTREEGPCRSQEADVGERTSQLRWGDSDGLRSGILPTIGGPGPEDQDDAEWSWKEVKPHADRGFLQLEGYSTATSYAIQDRGLPTLLPRNAI